MIITNDRLEEIALAPREAMIAKAEAADLVAAYKSHMGAVTKLDQDQYNNLVRDAMQWRARFTAPDIVPRSRLDAVEVELATAEQTLKQVQQWGHAEITRLEVENKRLREALAYIANIREGEQPSSSDISKAKGAARMALSDHRETPWADLQLRIPDKNCLLEGSRGPQCRYCGEVYADPITDDGHSRNCNRPKS